VLSGQGDDGRTLTGVNALTSPHFCPQSRQPELKHAAVALDKINLPWRLTAMAWLPADSALALREQMWPVSATPPWCLSAESPIQPAAWA
jgi:assimilatory nitrate reductase catalytic subunit